MVAVATKLDLPIKLYMPHISYSIPNNSCSLLGLGDILVPGIFITFMARFGTQVVKSEVYFYSAMLAYTLSLLLCGACLWIFSSAQPALLYIVPALYITVLGLGMKRNELDLLKKGLPPPESSSEEKRPRRVDDEE